MTLSCLCGNKPSCSTKDSKSDLQSVLLASRERFATGSCLKTNECDCKDLYFNDAAVSGDILTLVYTKYFSLCVKPREETAADMKALCIMQLEWYPVDYQVRTKSDQRFIVHEVRKV